MRKILWFSCGACSTVSLMLSLKIYPDLIAVYCDTGGEHPDNLIFLHSIEKLFSINIKILKSRIYNDHFDVFHKTGFIKSPNGARCTIELKKRLRYKFQLPTDLQIFGYSSDEIKRAESFNKAYPEIFTYYPLIDSNLTKKNCLGLLWQNKIEIPTMYKLGYNNNNCIGCPKGGKGYWNKIKIDFPETFKKMCDLESKLNYTIFDKPLTDLKSTEGYKKDFNIECDFNCQSINHQLELQ